MSAFFSIEGVSKRFRGLVAVDRVSCDVTRGEIFAVIGPNGAGKTTLFNMIAGALKLDEGAIAFEGERIDGLRPDEVCRRGIARTFQIVRPFPALTVEDNVMIGALTRLRRVREAREEAERVIALCGLGPHAAARARALPIGLRKRLEVARALATRPRLLLLDEVMAGLNPSELTGIIDLVRRVHAEGVTLIVIEHVMAAMMRLAQRIVMLHHGEKIAEGTPAEIAHDRRVIDAYLGDEFNLAEA